MSCPICGSEKYDHIFHLCDNMKILGESFHEEEADIVSCSFCGLVYMNTPATQYDFLSYYKQGAVAPKYYEMFGKSETEHYYEHILDVIKPYISEKSKLLDVAGAWGELGKFLYDKGFTNITVVDSNEGCIQEVTKKGIRAKQCSTLDMASELTEQYNLIVLNHTLEHILDVAKTMENISALLSEEGYLFIEIPDAASYVDENSAPFNFLTYEHVLHLTANDLNNIGRLYGYEILVMEPYYKKVSKYPSVFAVMKKTGQTKETVYSDTGKEKMEQYIERSKQMIDQFLAPLRASGDPLILWGIGASTAVLLESFSGCNVTTLVDSNPKRQGLAFTIDNQKLTIESPEKAKEGTIVILSIPYCASIEKQIRSMGLKNKIVTLSRGSL